MMRLQQTWRVLFGLIALVASVGGCAAPTDTGKPGTVDCTADAEACDGLDNDCDGAIDEADAVDATTWHIDVDGDEYGVVSTFDTVACVAPAGFVADGTDCDDADAAIHPGATETCNGSDDDCNEVVDDQAVDPSTFYADTDGDTYGDPEVSTTSCDPTAGWVANATDCDDGDGAVYPGAAETCDGIDDDCDGDIDEEAVDAPTWYIDIDADGFGVSGVYDTAACVGPVGFASLAGDCDDADAAVSPDAPESCDGVDDDCDGDVDEGDAVDASVWYADADGDGWGDEAATEFACAAPPATSDTPGDCDDGRADVSPVELERCDGVDDDCDGDVDEADALDAGLWYPDADGDGAGDDALATLACDSPGPDWLGSGGDCDDGDASISPGAVDACDGVDNDCDGAADDDLDQAGCTDFWLDDDGDGYGVDGDVECACVATWGRAAVVGGDCDDGEAGVNPGVVTDDCNVIELTDDDCDGLIDEDGGVCVYGGVPETPDPIWFPLASTSSEGNTYTGHIHDARDFPATKGTTVVYSAGDGTVRATFDGCRDATAPNKCTSLNECTTTTGADCNCTEAGGNYYGNFIEIEHFDGTFTKYAHLEEGSIGVAAGDVVCAGQAIANVGASGFVCSGGSGDGAHLHFEVRLPEEADYTDPLPGAGTSGGTCTANPGVFDDCATYHGGQAFTDDCDDIDALHSDGVLTGSCAEDQADPDTCGVDRGTAVAWIGKLVSADDASTYETCDLACTDVSASDWYAPWFDAMMRLDRGDGITAFTSSDTCDPQGELTRLHFLKAAMEAAGLPTASSSGGVVDLGDVETEMLPWVHGAVAAGVFGTGDQLGPNRPVDYGWAARVSVAIADRVTDLSADDADFLSCDASCTPSATLACVGDDVHSFDSCGADEGVEENCGSGDSCVETSATTAECSADCGNGAVDAGEDCDGGDLDGATCRTLGHDSGSLSCSSCRYDEADCCDERAYLACYGGSTGDVYWYDSCGVREGTAYDACSSSEVCDSGSASCVSSAEDCNNGTDDDGDGDEDCFDSDCVGDSDCTPTISSTTCTTYDRGESTVCTISGSNFTSADHVFIGCLDGASASLSGTSKLTVSGDWVCNCELDVQEVAYRHPGSSDGACDTTTKACGETKSALAVGEAHIDTVSPSSGSRGSSYTVYFTGCNLCSSSGSTAVYIADVGLGTPTCSGSADQVYATATIDSGASTGVKDCAVAQGTGFSCSDTEKDCITSCFTVK